MAQLHNSQQPFTKLQIDIFKDSLEQKGLTFFSPVDCLLTSTSVHKEN